MTWQASKNGADFKNMHYNIIIAISIEINDSIAMNLFYFEPKNICIKQLSIYSYSIINIINICSCI